MADIIFYESTHLACMPTLDNIDIALKEKIARRIKSLRESSGKKQSAFASDTEKDRQTLSRWETGRGATIYTINKLCKELGISLSQFFDDPIFIEK
jgi:transcriptional regulator with XRE-family HTH domain